MDIKYLFKHSPKYLWLLIFITMIISAFDGVVLSMVISAVTRFTVDSSIGSLIRFSLGAILIYSVIMLANLLNAVLRSQLTYHLNMHVKDRYIANKLKKANSHSDTDEIVSFMLNDFKLVESNYLDIVLDVISMTVMGLVSMGYLLYLSPMVALLFIIFSFLPMLPAKLFGTRIEHKSVDWSQANESFTGSLKNIFAGRKTVRTYNAYDFATGQIYDKLENAENTNRHFANLQSLVNFIAGLLSWMSYIVPITVALYLVIHGRIEAGVVIAMFLASDRVIYPLRRVGMMLNQIATTKDARQKIYEVIKDSQVSEDNEEMLEPDLVLEAVDFAYGEREIFKNLSYQFDYGKKYLISAASGTGKSTLLDLMQGVLEPNQGKIYLSQGGKQVCQGLTHLISRINQDPVLFQTTIRNNLCLGRSISDQVLTEVLEQVGLARELGKDILDLQYDPKTMDLSGGQKQRLEIARAIVHHKPILLVDEATSALDAKNAAIVRQILAQLDSTVIEVAHHYKKDVSMEQSPIYLTLEGQQLVSNK